MPATTLEFFLKENTPFVSFNSRTLSLEDFSREPGSKLVLIKICKTILQKHTGETRCENPVCMQYPNQEFRYPCGAMDIVGNFIRSHFMEHDRTLDVIVSENSDHVTFNFEK